MAINECLGYQLDFFGQPAPAPAIQAKMEDNGILPELAQSLANKTGKRIAIEPAGIRAEPNHEPTLDPELTPRKGKPEINLQKIEAELQEDASELHVKVVKSNGNAARVSIRETDKGVHIRINPKHIRTQAQLDAAMEYCRSSINWDNQV